MHYHIVLIDQIERQLRRCSLQSRLQHQSRQAQLIPFTKCQLDCNLHLEFLPLIFLRRFGCPTFLFYFILFIEKL